MKPSSFDYFRPDTPEQALEALRSVGEDARLLAGGQSLMAVLNMRLAQPRLIIDISRIAALKPVTVEDGKLVVRASATQAEVEWRPTLVNEVPLLALAFPNISHFQIRNRGTVCGSIAHADPSAELPLVLAVLNGDVVLRSARRRRTVPASSFFAGMLMTAREPDEMIEAVRYPLHVPGTGYGFVEHAMRHGDFALVAAAAVVRGDSIVIAIGGVADRPVVERWPLLEGDALESALNDLSWKLGAQDDAQVSAPYRRHLVRGLGMRAISQARAHFSATMSA